MLYEKLRQTDTEMCGVESGGDADREDMLNLTTNRKARGLRNLLNDVALFGLLVLLLTNTIALWHLSNSQQHVGTHNGVGDDNETIITYGFNQRYMTLSPKYEHLWDDMLPEDSSIVSLPDNSDGSTSIGAIAMFHQLHCLAWFRKSMQKAQAGEDIGMDLRDNPHWPHCLDYLRMTFLCQPDFTIERPPLINGTLRPDGIDGADDVRHCKPNKALFDYRAKHGAERFS